LKGVLALVTGAGSQPEAGRYTKGIITTTATIAIGLLVSRDFRIGALAGCFDLLIKIVPLSLFRRSGPSSAEEVRESQEYIDRFLRNSATDSCIFMPVVEEIFFRLCMQWGIQVLLTKILPHIIWVFPFGTLSLSAMIAIVIASVAFGLMHLANDHGTVRVQAMGAFIGGLIKGVLSVKYGFVAAAAAHICNNALLVIPLKILLTKRGLSQMAEGRGIHIPAQFVAALEGYHG
jgi:hypothetical protein